MRWQACWGVISESVSASPLLPRVEEQVAALWPLLVPWPVSCPPSPPPSRSFPWAWAAWRVCCHRYKRLNVRLRNTANWIRHLSGVQLDGLHRRAAGELRLGDDERFAPGLQHLVDFAWVCGKHKKKTELLLRHTRLVYFKTIVPQQTREAGYFGTGRQEQNVVQALIRSLNAVHGYLDVVVVAYIKRGPVMYGVNPVAHFWVVLDQVDGGQGQALAVSDALQTHGHKEGHITRRMFGGRSFKQLYKLQL